MQLKKFNTATPFCKVCMKPFNPRSLVSNAIASPTICSKCRVAFKPRVKRWLIDDVPCMSLYEYGDGMRSAIYQFKGCGDYELRSVFVENVRFWLKLKFSKYIVVPAPSWIEADEQRGFNHVYAIFEQLGLPMVRAIIKTSNHKQSDQNVLGRKEIIKHLALPKRKLIEHKNVVIVDDVFTTGNTIRSCIRLVKQAKADKVAVIVLAKVKQHESGSK